MKNLVNTYEIWTSSGISEVIMNKPGQGPRTIAAFKNYEDAKEYIIEQIRKS